MLKLYKLTDTAKQYWETWENDGVHTVHWGELGTEGNSKEIKSTFFTKAEKVIQKEIDGIIKEGFSEIDDEEHHILLIEYTIDGMGTEEDLNKRHSLEDRMNETLGWVGLGNCDGGSIGSNTMEVCCFVVDFDIAKKIIEDDLADTEFSNYSRIYAEENEGQQLVESSPSSVCINPVLDNDELKSLKNSILEGMLDYIDDDTEYTKKDVEECGRILEEHIATISKTEDKNNAMQCVKNTVLKLNELNQKAGEELIETDQREDICEFIIKVGVLLGFNEEDEDVTEEWREW